MTLEQQCILTGLTSVNFVANWGNFMEYVDNIMGRCVFSYELTQRSVSNRIKEYCAEQFKEKYDTFDKEELMELNKKYDLGLDIK